MSQDPPDKCDDEPCRPTRPVPMPARAPKLPLSGTSYSFVDTRDPQAERSMLPHMVTRVRLAGGPSPAADDERHTADLTEAAANAMCAMRGAMPEEFFYCMYSLLQNQFRREIGEDPGFLRVRYLTPTAAGLVDTCGPVTIAYDAPFADVSWSELQQVVLARQGPGPGGEGPRGIHFVHEEGTSAGGGSPVAGDVWPGFSMDVGIDGSGSILEATADVEQWSSFVMRSPGPREMQASLKYASGLMLDFVQCLVRLAETMDNPIPRDSSLVDFFFLLDAMRTADPRNHEADLAAIPAGDPMFAFEATARFRGRELLVTVADSTGFVQRTAREICDMSRRVLAPLRGFSVSIKGDGRTATLERRYSDQRHGPPVPVRLPR